MIYFLLPVYNEEKNLEKLLENIRSEAGKLGKPYSVVISDDGSSDGTMEVASKLMRSMPLIVVSSPVNKGPGSAFDIGFRRIISDHSPADIIVTMEGDNTSDLSILSKMLRSIDDGADIVLASCYGSGGAVKGTSFYRKVLSRVANVIIGVFFVKHGVSTFSSFYRCYRADIISRAYGVYGEGFIEEKGFTCAVDILLKLCRLDPVIKEVPMILDCEQRKGKSKMKIVKTTLLYFKIFLREVYRRSVRRR